MKPKVSVVIAAYNAAATVADTVRAVMNQPLPPAVFECIVVDDASTDDTAEVARQAGATVLRLPKNLGIAGARNAGINHASGEWIVFTDSDCVPSRRWLSLIAAETDTTDDSVLGIAGKILGLDSRTPAARFVDLTGGLDAETYLKHPTMPWAPSGNLAYRRASLLAVGSFDPQLKTYEAADLHLRLLARFGGRTIYLPAALVLHRHRATWRGFWKQQRNYGVGYAQFIRKHANLCPWKTANEIRAWGHILAQVPAACFRRGNAGLVGRGLFVKLLAQRLGFVSTYYSSAANRQPLPMEKTA